MSGSPRSESELPSEATRAAVRRIDTWLRLRIGVFTAIIVIGTMLVLDFILVFVLPVPEAIARNSRGDLLLLGPLALVVLFGVIAVELRSVARAVRTLKLGLRLSEEQRQRSLRTALTLPVTLPLFLLGVATAGNLVTFVLDLLGRSPTLWYSLHVTVVAQCVIVCACFPVFVFARFTLRPFVQVVARDAEPLGRSLGLRGRIALLITTLVTLVAVPAASLLSLQLDAQAVRRNDESKHRLAALLGTELHEMGLHSFRRYVQTVDLGPDNVAFLLDPQGRVVPRSLSRLVAKARLPSRSSGTPVLKRLGANRHLVAIPVVLSEGGAAWVGMAYGPGASGRGRRVLVFLELGLFLLCALLAVLLGAGVARELRAVAGRLEILSRGDVPAPLSCDVGSVAEIGRLIDGINDLLAAVERRNLRGFVQIEQAAEAARSKTQFLANMSHDLKSPLTAVLGFVDFLQTELNGKLNERQRSRVAELAVGARRLESLIIVLLDRAKLESGRLRLDRAWTPPATLVSRAMDNVAHQLGQSARNRVRVEVQPGLAPLYVDPERTAQALALIVLLVQESVLTARARSGVFPAVRESGRGTAPEASPAGLQLVLRTGRFVTKSGHGTEITVGCLDPGAFDPREGDWFVDLVDSGKQTRFRPGAVLAKQLVTRQRGLIVPAVEPGVLAGFRVRFPTGITGEMPAISRG